MSEWVFGRGEPPENETQAKQRQGSVRVRRTYKNYADIYSELHLLPSAPRPVIDAAYRALSRMYHPDLVGNHEAQLRINEAYKKIIANLTEETDPGR